MNSLDLIKKFKDLLYMSYNNHIKINEESYNKNNDIKKIITSTDKKIGELTEEILNIEQDLQKNIETLECSYNNENHQKLEYYENCKQELSAELNDKDRKIRYFSIILNKAETGTKFLVQFANDPNNYDFVLESKKIISNNNNVISELKIMQNRCRNITLKGINVSEQSISQINYQKIFSTENIDSLVEMFENQYIIIINKILDYGMTLPLFKKSKLQEIFVDFRVIFDIKADIEICINDNIKRIKDSYNSIIADKETQIQIALKDISDYSKNDLSKTKNNLIKDAEEKINLKKIEIDHLQKAINDETIPAMKTKFIKEIKEKHIEESVNLREQLEEKLSVEEIKKILSLQSAIESCCSYADFKCPNDFSDYTVIGNISFDYYNDPKINQFKYITDAVDSFFEQNGLCFPQKDGHSVFKIPLVIEWQNFKGISYIYDNDSYNEIKDAYQSTVFHLFADIRPKSTVFTMIDGILPAGIFAPFPSFVKVGESEYINRKIYNNSEDIENLLNEIKAQVEQATAGFHYDSIIEANRDLINKKLMNILFVASGINGVISSEATDILSDIVSGGKNVGYYCFAMCDSRDFVEDIYKDNYQGIFIQYDSDAGELVLKHDNETFNIELYKNPEYNEYSMISEIIAECYEAAEKYGTFSFVDSKVYETLGQNARAINNITVKSAMDIDDHMCNFILDDKNINYLVLGLPRSGKSRFMHILITNIIRKYSPNDANIYIMSYKAQGTEISLFAKFDIPHIKMVKLNRNGYAFVKFIESIIQERNRRDIVFKENPSMRKFDNYSDYMSFYYSNNAFSADMEPLPRIVVFIDEIQEVLSDENVSKEFIGYFNSIVSTAGCFGIHIIFLTQYLSNFINNGIGIDKLQGTSKVIFNCLPNDVTALVPSTENIIPLMENTPGRAFMINGVGSSLKKIFVPLYTFERETQVLENMSLYYDGTPCKTLIVKNSMFDGKNNIYTQFISDPISRVFNDILCVGELICYTDDENINIRMADTKTDNIMLLGDNTAISQSITISLYLSLMGYLITADKYKVSQVIFVNCGELKRNDIIVSTYQKLYKTLEECNVASDFLKYIPCGNIKEQLGDYIREYADMAACPSPEFPDVYLFLYGIHNTNQLDDFYSYLGTINTQYKKYVHIVVWSDRKSVMEDFLKKTSLERAFKYKLTFASSEDENDFILGCKAKTPKGVAKMKPLSFNESPCFVPYDFCVNTYQPQDTYDPINKFIKASKDFALQKRDRV